MKACPSCEQQNSDDANFCLRCGAALDSVAPALPNDEEQLSRMFIGPTKAILFSLGKGWSWGRADDHYMETFRRFSTAPTPRFALSWHWSVFLLDPFLWFLYRKMYLYAFVYAVGPVISIYLTGDLTVGVVWQIMAALSANYIYFWHVKEYVGEILGKRSLDDRGRARHLQESGGVQPYVMWVGVALVLLKVILVSAALIQGSPGGELLEPDDAVSPSERKFY